MSKFEFELVNQGIDPDELVELLTQMPWERSEIRRAEKSILIATITSDLDILNDEFEVSDISNWSDLTEVSETQGNIFDFENEIDYITRNINSDRQFTLMTQLNMGGNYELFVVITEDDEYILLESLLSKCHPDSGGKSGGITLEWFSNEYSNGERNQVTAQLKSIIQGNDHDQFYMTEYISPELALDMLVYAAEC